MCFRKIIGMGQIKFVQTGSCTCSKTVKTRDLISFKHNGINLLGKPGQCFDVTTQMKLNHIDSDVLVIRACFCLAPNCLYLPPLKMHKGNNGPIISPIQPMQ